jgi:hypothetical protein
VASTSCSPTSATCLYEREVCDEIRHPAPGAAGLRLLPAGPGTEPPFARDRGVCPPSRRRGRRPRGPRPCAAGGARRLEGAASGYRPRRSPGKPGTGTATATATGAGSMRSSGVTRRSPTNSSARSIKSGGSPHPGQASRWAATAGVKRSRQLGQQPWVMTDPFIRSPKGQCTGPLARFVTGSRPSRWFAPGPARHASQGTRRSRRR